MINFLGLGKWEISRVPFLLRPDNPNEMKKLNSHEATNYCSKMPIKRKYFKAFMHADSEIILF